MTRPALFTLLLACAACDGGGPDVTSLRVENATAIDFDSVAVGLPGRETAWASVPAGGVSDYREAEGVTETSNLVVEAEGGPYYRLLIHDSPSGRRLGSGRYTFVLRLDGQTLRLRVNRD